MARLEAGMTARLGRRSHPASQHRLEIGDELAVIVAGQGPPRQEAEAMGACVIEPVLQGTAGAGAPVEGTRERLGPATLSGKAPVALLAHLRQPAPPPPPP